MCTSACLHGTLEAYQRTHTHTHVREHTYGRYVYALCTNVSAPVRAGLQPPWSARAREHTCRAADVLCVHGREQAWVRTVHPGGSTSEGPHVQTPTCSCAHVHTLKRKPSALRVRADRVTFSKGSAARDRAGPESTCWQEVSGAADS